MEVDEEAGQGMVYVDGVQGKRISVGEVAKTAQINDWGTIAAVDSLRQVSCPPCFMAYFIEVEVNTETGVIKPTKALAYADVGQVVNPDLARGQLFGGLYRGLGYALLEDTHYDETSGDLTCGGWITDFKMLTANDLPKMDNIDVHFTDTYEPTGPFGAKGIGEAALNPVAAALANAVYNAIGVRFNEIPITPEKVLKKINDHCKINSAKLALKTNSI
jgi:xanthine dehydrogenase molybdenum-binding subunit